ncbi:MAG: autotransporter domain-containing protein [Crocinitomicaceae bacterium]|nr:autotransporter domain-containing protein [Crocinitomicaceae bacterium]
MFYLFLGMRKWIVLLLIILCFKANAQNLSFGIAYQYQKAFQWEQMIDNYNSNAPWLVKNQPYLNACASANLQYVFGSKSIVHHGIGFHYVWSRSFADNVDSTNRLDMHQYNFGYILQFHDEEKLKNFFFDFGFNFSINEVYQKFKNQTLDYKRNAGSGWGGNFDFKFGYKLAFGPNAWMSPFVGAGYTYTMMGDTWNTFQTDGLSFSKNHFVYAKVGVQFEFRLPRKKGRNEE